MSFSAVTCLTYTGTTTLGGILDLYSDIDGYTTPFKTNVDLSAITGNQCPYYIDNVPDGTTIVKLHDPITDCCATFPVNNNNLCTTCNLNFDLYSGSTVGRIVAGNITGDCENNITDYKIFWYETNDLTTPVFTSGKGTEYQPYSYTHPLTGTSAIFAPAGTYKPVMDKIKISGLTFSQTGGTNNIPAELDCFNSTTVYVDYFKCDNGTTSDNPLYSHRVNFLSAGVGISPQTLYSDFLFTGNTNYFAWKFKGFSVEDRLRLTYFAQEYTEPIIVEDLVIGSNLAYSDLRLSIVPKSARTGNYIAKVTCLTGITRTPNDFLRMEVIPNTANTQTNWDFYFTCLNTFNPGTIKSTPYKISASTITTSTGSCNTNDIRLSVFVNNPINSDDYYRYYFGDGYSTYGDSPTWWGNEYTSVGNPYLSFLFNLYTLRPQYGVAWIKYNGYSCSPPTSNTITFKKYISGGTGIIDMEFNNINDFNAYYNSYLNVSTGTSSSYGGTCTSAAIGSVSGTPYDPTDIRYYRYYLLYIPSSTGGTFCNSDGVTIYGYQIHTSTQVTTGFTSGNYTLRFTMPTMVDGLSYPTTCSIQPNIINFVNNVNFYSTGTSTNYTGTTTVGSRYNNPFIGNFTACSGSTTNTSKIAQGYLYQSKYLNETITYTGTTPTLVPSLTAITNYNFLTSGYTLVNSTLNRDYYGKYSYYYNVILNNPLDNRDFQIYGYKPTGLTLGSSILIYSYTGATSAYTIHDPTFFV